MTTAEIKTALSKLPLQDLQQIRNRLKDLIEDHLEPTDECKPSSNAPNAKSQTAQSPEREPPPPSPPR